LRRRFPVSAENSVFGLSYRAYIGCEGCGMYGRIAQKLVAAHYRLSWAFANRGDWCYLNFVFSTFDSSLIFSPFIIPLASTRWVGLAAALALFWLCRLNRTIVHQLIATNSPASLAQHWLKTMHSNFISANRAGKKGLPEISECYSSSIALRPAMLARHFLSWACDLSHFVTRFRDCGCGYFGNWRVLAKPSSFTWPHVNRGDYSMVHGGSTFGLHHLTDLFSMPSRGCFYHAC